MGNAMHVDRSARLTLGKLLASSSRQYPAKEAIVFRDYRLTYRALEDRANRVANMLSGLGLGKGDRCAILLYNRAEWAELYFGLAKAGIIAVPVNFRFTPAEVKYVIADSGAKALIYEEGFESRVRELRSEETSVADFVCMAATPLKPSPYEELLSGAPATTPTVEVAETDPFFIAYTSGTTGFPKGALVPHRNLLENHIVAAKMYGNLEHRDRFLLIMPVFHSNSTWFLQVMVMLGGTAVIHHSGGFDAEEVIRLIAQERVTMISLVPTMLSMILNLPGATRERHDVSSLNRLLVSSAPLMTRIKEEALKYFKGAKLFEGYGSTETGSVTVLGPEDQLRKVRSVGIAAPGKEIRVLDEDGHDVPRGEIGEIYVRGFGMLLQEYWHNPQGSSEAFRGSWCTVGDMGRMDEEGYLYLEDRKKEMIISGGENVYPTEVENVLVRHPGVLEAAVVGIPDEHWGEKVHAALVTRDGAHVSVEEILEFCMDKLAGYKRPKSIAVVPELPKSPTGKILRRKVREPFWGVHKSLYF